MLNGTLVDETPVAMLARTCIRSAGSEANLEEMSSMGPKKYRSDTASATSHPSVPLQ